MFDVVMVPCPNCGEQYRAQSKSGDCDLSVFPLEMAPVQTLVGLVDDKPPYDCARCGQRFDVCVTVGAVVRRLRPESEERK